MDGWTDAYLTSLTARSPGDSPSSLYLSSSASDLSFLSPSSPHFSLFSAATKPFTLTRWGCPLPSREDGLRRGWGIEVFCLSAAARPLPVPRRPAARSGDPRGCAGLSPATRGDVGNLAGDRKGARPGGQRQSPETPGAGEGEGWPPPRINQRGCPAGSPGAVRSVCAGRELQRRAGQRSLGSAARRGDPR